MKTRRDVTATAQGRAVAYLVQKYESEYRVALMKYQAAEGGHLEHTAESCPFGKDVHLQRYRRSYGYARTAAVAELREKYRTEWDEAYEGEIEYLLEEGIEA